MYLPNLWSIWARQYRPGHISCILFKTFPWAHCLGSNLSKPSTRNDHSVDLLAAQKILSMSEARGSSAEDSGMAEAEHTAAEAECSTPGSSAECSGACSNVNDGPITDETRLEQVFPVTCTHMRATGTVRSRLPSLHRLLFSRAV